jgi:hypothetical protein
VLQADAQALIAHGRFLQEKFGHAPTTAPKAPAGPRQSIGPVNPLDLEV